MSENKQNEVLTGYEQLKRRNRRRLVTASSLVAASCILLAAALSSDPADSNPAPQAGETGATESQTANTAQTPALKSAAENGKPPPTNRRTWQAKTSLLPPTAKSASLKT